MKTLASKFLVSGAEKSWNSPCNPISRASSLQVPSVVSGNFSMLFGLIALADRSWQGFYRLLFWTFSLVGLTTSDGGQHCRSGKNPPADIGLQERDWFVAKVENSMMGAATSRETMM